MRSWVARTLGFAVPTVAVVTAAHLSAQNTAGEALDGVVSGLWFTALFAVGAGLRSWWPARRAAGESSTVAGAAPRAALDGLMLATLVWGALWAFWSVVPHDGPDFPRMPVFIAQSALMALVGALIPALPGARARRTA